MNDTIIMQINECVKNAKLFKDLNDTQNFNLYKGQLVGLGIACFIYGKEDEGKYAVRKSKEYPFEVVSPIADSGIIGSA